MRQFVIRLTAIASLLLLPVAASAQTSGITGVVSDSSGAILPGVTVEVSSPALIEKTRSSVTDGSGRYNITQLRPGVYTIAFTLPGFNTVRREGVELTSDFTATINAEMRVGAIEETITVAAESPVVDVQSITARTVMTRDVLDQIPTGRNIQAVGIMIPGTTLAPGGGGALSRDVGGSGNLQQSPLQYRGSGDTVQTVEGLRLNNLCAQGAYSGVYWNDGSFQEISYITGADSAEMGQGGIRVNMVPRDGGNSFRGSIVANGTREAWVSDNLGDNLAGDLTFNPNNRLTNVGKVQKIWDVNPSVGGPILRDRLWWYFTFRHWGSDKTVADAYFDANPDPRFYVQDRSRPGIDDGHIVSRAGRLSWQVSSKDKIASYHDDQNKYRNHWGISALIPPEASAIQVTPTSFVHVTRWTRTQSNRLLFDAGIGIYDQNYTELYQPEVLGGFADKVFDVDQVNNARIYSILDASTSRRQLAWNNPADRYSILRTYSGSMSYVTGSHSFKVGAQVGEGDRRNLQVFTGDVSAVTFTAGNPTSITHRLPTDIREGIKADVGIYAQDRWTMGRMTLNLGVRYDWFRGENQVSSILPSRLNAGTTFGECPDGKNDLTAGCVGQVQDWKDISPRVGVAYDLFGDGRTAIKGSVARYVAGQNVAVANANNPATGVSLTSTRSWTDRDGNNLPFDANGNYQLDELGPNPNVNFGQNVNTTFYDPEVLDGWFVRGYNWEYSVAAQHLLFGRTSLNGGWYRRQFGNQTFTDDLRYSPADYDGPFCIQAPASSELPGGGNYPVCGLYDLKPAVFAEGRTPNNLVTFAKNFGDGETNIYSGFDVNVESRFPNGAFARFGIGATRRSFNDCYQTLADSPESELYADGSRYCDREYGYRPDAKAFASYPLPLGIQLAATYQFSRGVQTGGAGPSILASWAMNNALLNANGSTLGRNLHPGVANKTVQLIREGLDYGDQNLNQLDVRGSKRFTFGRYRFRIDLDLYNVFNSNWPYTVNTAFANTTTSAWLRPTRALDGRMFKIGGQFDF
jgi:hypothetical protein